MEGNTGSYRPQEGAHNGVSHGQEAGEVPQFTNSFAEGNPIEPGVAQQESDAPPTQKRNSLKDYSQTDEWDASKTPPSRFQQRKGSVFSTPASRDGHVEKNLMRDNDFHEKHSKMFEKAKNKVKDAKDALGSVTSTHHRRKSSSSGDKSKGAPVI
ncbi:hypothetical protein BX600DRAFT_505291 [Xylariales sp. PMI_506]|nr:hypothetical protein BX600DRAFT_505291 [Xylariales sp. PMI_506]